MPEPTTPPYIAFYKAGRLTNAAVILRWYDADCMAIEYLSRQDLQRYTESGTAPPDAEGAEYRETTKDSISLTQQPEDGYKLHDTWETVAHDFIQSKGKR